MNKYFLYVFFINISFLSAQNQEFNIQNAVPSIGDLKATHYNKDTTANAFYIFEEGFTEIESKNDYNLVTRYTAKIKILNKDGFEEANIAIPISKSDNKKEKIRRLYATTYNLKEGAKTQIELDPTAIYTEEHENYDLVKFTFPDLKPGSVLVYNFERESPFLFNFETWWFQGDLPKEYSKFVSKIPSNYEYYIKTIGEQKLEPYHPKIEENCFQLGDSTNPGDCVVTEYKMYSIPAFKEEEYLTSRNNYISRLEFELKRIIQLDGSIQKYTKTWNDVDRELELSKGIGRQLKRDNLVDDLLPEVIKSLPNNEDKAKEIFDFVKENYRWNGNYRLYTDMNLKDLLKEKTGNVSAINTLLHNLYDVEGFNVLPIISSSRNNGFPSKIHPAISDYNYLMVALTLDDNKEVILDATEKNIDFGRIPFRSLNKYARLMDWKNGSSWIDLEPKEYSRLSFRDSIKIHPDGTSTGFSEQILTGYHALRLRNKIEEVSEDELFRNVLNPNEHTNSTKISFLNKEDVSENLHLKFELQNKSQKINELIYFNPFNFKFFDENPFKLEKRTYPIDFGYKDIYMYSAVIEIPDNYSVIELPENKMLTMPENAGRLIFSTQKINDTTLSVQCRLNFAKATYPSVFYEGLKKIFDEIISVQTNSLIVLKENS